MPSKGIIALLGGWEGYRVGTAARFEAGELSELSRLEGSIEKRQFNTYVNPDMER